MDRRAFLRNSAGGLLALPAGLTVLAGHQAGAAASPAFYVADKAVRKAVAVTPFKRAADIETELVRKLFPKLEL